MFHNDIDSNKINLIVIKLNLCLSFNKIFQNYHRFSRQIQKNYKQMALTLRTKMDTI